MNDYSWDTTFLALFDRCCVRYRDGDRDFSTYYTEDDLAFLAAVGYRTREFFDWVEDHCDEPDRVTPEAALLVAGIRRDYFFLEQGGEQPDAPDLLSDELPGRDVELGGHRWLPRILAKARAKLSGTLHPNVMYGCGGDRAFLQSHGIHPADFLRRVWASEGDDAVLVNWLDGRSGA